MNIYLPANLEIENLLKENPPGFSYEIENFKYLVGNLIRLKFLNNKYIKEDKDIDFVPLNSTYLQQRIRNYNQYLSYLIENDVFKTDGLYIPNAKSRGYKLADKYEEEEFILDKLTQNNLIKKRHNDVSKDISLRRHYNHLIKWFNEYLHINHEAAEDYLRGLLYKQEKHGDNKARKKYRLHQINVDRIRRGHFDYTVDDTGKRFHSNLTNLKSGLRNFITYKGETLCSIDVKNCQPFISTILFNPEFYVKEKGKLNLYSLSPDYYKECLPYISEILSILSDITSPIMLVKSHETEASSDLELYCTLVDKGRLYPYISQRFQESTGITLNINIPDEKRQLKDAIFLTFFSNNKFYGQREAIMKRFFDEIFPTVYKIFSLIKMDRHQRLSIILQLVESEIVLRRVTKCISRNNPNLPIYTIHDSVVTLASHKELVGEILKQEFHTAIGLEPSLRFEMWEN